MPRLMEKKDWMQTVANVSAAESVWCENILPNYEVVPLLKINTLQPSGPSPRCRPARELIGCCRDNYNGLHTAAGIMKELRKGEE